MDALDADGDERRQTPITTEFQGYASIRLLNRLSGNALGVVRTSRQDIAIIRMKLASANLRALHHD